MKLGIFFRPSWAGLSNKLSIENPTKTTATTTTTTTRTIFFSFFATIIMIRFFLSLSFFLYSLATTRKRKGIMKLTLSFSLSRVRERTNERTSERASGRMSLFVEKKWRERRKWLKHKMKFSFTRFLPVCQPATGDKVMMMMMMNIINLFFHFLFYFLLLLVHFFI